MMASAASSAAVTGEPSALLRNPVALPKSRIAFAACAVIPVSLVHQIGACGGIEGGHGRFLAISTG